MFLAVHAAVGALAGNAVASPSVALVLGFLSHFFVDMVPHGDEHMYQGYQNGKKVIQAILYVGGDAIATAVLIAVFFLRQDFFSPVTVAFGIIGALLPDLLVGMHEVVKMRRRRWLRLFNRKLAWFNELHMRNHHVLIKRFRKFEKDIPLRYGLLLQGATLVFLVKIIL